jgi:hypothetical protein
MIQIKSVVNISKNFNFIFEIYCDENYEENLE